MSTLDEQIAELRQDFWFRVYYALYAPWFWLVKLQGNVRHWLIKAVGGVTNEAWHQEALDWEGTARDYGDRLRELGQFEWLVEYHGW